VREVEAELPSRALTTGPGVFGDWHSDCDWLSDFNGEAAESWQMTVTPSGRVHMTSHYPSVPRVCFPNPG
jgi:hypothetical protein